MICQIGINFRIKWVEWQLTQKKGHKLIPEWTFTLGGLHNLMEGFNIWGIHSHAYITVLLNIQVCLWSSESEQTLKSTDECVCLWLCACEQAWPREASNRKTSISGQSISNKNSVSIYTCPESSLFSTYGIRRERHRTRASSLGESSVRQSVLWAGSVTCTECQQDPFWSRSLHGNRVLS